MNFLVSGLILNCLIHFEFIFAMVLTSVLILFFSVQLSTFPSFTYKRVYLFSTVYSCLLHCRFAGHKCMGLFLGFLSFLLIYMSVFSLVLYCFNLLKFPRTSWGQRAWFIQLHFSFSRLLFQFSSVQSLSHVWLFVTPWTAACQASLPITNSRSLLKLTSVE